MSLSTPTPIVKAALICLGEVWPRAVAFDDLLDLARSRLASARLRRPRRRRAGPGPGPAHGLRQRRPAGWWSSGSARRRSPSRSAPGRSPAACRAAPGGGRRSRDQLAARGGRPDPARGPVAPAAGWDARSSGPARGAPPGLPRGRAQRLPGRPAGHRAEVRRRSSAASSTSACQVGARGPPDRLAGARRLERVRRDTVAPLGRRRVTGLRSGRRIDAHTMSATQRSRPGCLLLRAAKRYTRTSAACSPQSAVEIPDSPGSWPVPKPDLTAGRHGNDHPGATTLTVDRPRRWAPTSCCCWASPARSRSRGCSRYQLELASENDVDRRQGHRRQERDLERQPRSTRSPATSTASSAGSSPAALSRRKLRTYRAEVVPWPWFLTRTTDCRIFQNQTTPDIITGHLRRLRLQRLRAEAQGLVRPSGSTASSTARPPSTSSPG